MTAVARIRWPGVDSLGAPGWTPGSASSGGFRKHFIPTCSCM